ncbi:hypothetical protein B0H17DRAFT_1216291 [Mycena rosella]|uniref:Uncharacterized protein n=1 Tax=Mycena rosella TaxID=1033263 RepID=A0AAD7CBL7_MYCRO|nr:hypothetical protein B0H17DRAFT_1216291 [Mycena rosella]
MQTVRREWASCEGFSPPSSHSPATHTPDPNSFPTSAHAICRILVRLRSGSLSPFRVLDDRAHALAPPLFISPMRVSCLRALLLGDNWPHSAQAASSWAGLVTNVDLALAQVHDQRTRARAARSSPDELNIEEKRPSLHGARPPLSPGNLHTGPSLDAGGAEASVFETAVAGTDFLLRWRDAATYETRNE